MEKLPRPLIVLINWFGFVTIPIALLALLGVLLILNGFDLTDAAILGAAGIPAVLFGPGGAGLHSTEEYVLIRDVCTCRDALVTLARQFAAQSDA